MGEHEKYGGENINAGIAFSNKRKRIRLSFIVVVGCSGNGNDGERSEPQTIQNAAKINQCLSVSGERGVQVVWSFLKVDFCENLS
jgi:hypothetical protein